MKLPILVATPSSAQTLGRKGTLALTGLFAAFSMACTLDVQMKHDPVIATSSDQITFTAEADTGFLPESMEIRMFVEGTLVKTCTASPCVETLGPFPDAENDWIAYHVETTADFDVLGFTSTELDTDLGATGITEDNHRWRADSGVTHIPARWGAHSSVNTNVLFQRSDDYNDSSAADGLADFLDDLSTKIHDILMDKEEIWGKMEDINVYAYRRFGNTDAGCPGVLNANTAAETGSVIDDNGILHVDNFSDCTLNFNQFTAEGSTNTQAFLHEFSHSIFRQADEYDGPTLYFEAANEPNIFDEEDTCRDEQVLKGRDPDDCYQFTTRQTGWWGTHTGTTVMTNGLQTHPWSTESVERQRWWFDNN